jgi:hypothetical protein
VKKITEVIEAVEALEAVEAVEAVEVVEGKKSGSLALSAEALAKAGGLVMSAEVRSHGVGWRSCNQAGRAGWAGGKAKNVTNPLIIPSVFGVSKKFKSIV